jgi:replicative DNA helicase
MFLYRPSQFDKAASTHLVDLVVAKNRNGSIGKVKLVWQDQIVKFDSYKQE